MKAYLLSVLTLPAVLGQVTLMNQLMLSLPRKREEVSAARENVLETTVKHFREMPHDPHVMGAGGDPV